MQLPEVHPVREVPLPPRPEQRDQLRRGAAVVAFGPWKGFAVAMGGILVNALVAYWLGRTLAQQDLRLITNSNAIASMPVQAVTRGGCDNVSVGSRMATRAAALGSKHAIF